MTKKVDRKIDRDGIIGQLYDLQIFPKYLQGVNTEDVELYVTRFRRTEMYQKQFKIYRTLMESLTSLELELLLELVKEGMWNKNLHIIEETIRRTSGELSQEGYQEVKKLTDKFKE